MVHSRRGHDPARWGRPVLSRKARRAPRREPPADDDGEHRPARPRHRGRGARRSRRGGRRRYPDVPIPRVHEPHRHGRPPRGAGGGPRSDRGSLRAGRTRRSWWTSSSRRRSKNRDVHHRRALHRHQRHPRHVDVCPVDCIHVADRMLVIDPRSASTAAPASRSARSRRSSRRTRCPSGSPSSRSTTPTAGMDVVNELVQTYADENDVQNPRWTSARRPSWQWMSTPLSGMPSRSGSSAPPWAPTSS